MQDRCDPLKDIHLFTVMHDSIFQGFMDWMDKTGMGPGNWRELPDKKKRYYAKSYNFARLYSIGHPWTVDELRRLTQ